MKLDVESLGLKVWCSGFGFAVPGLMFRIHSGSMAYMKTLAVRGWEFGVRVEGATFVRMRG